MLRAAGSLLQKSYCCRSTAVICCAGLQGLTLTFDEITSVFTRSPQLLLLGMVSCTTRQQQGQQQ
jgi:hypothetical protein